jgi:hypothetical protein
MVWLAGAEPGDEDRAAALEAIRGLAGGWRESTTPVTFEGTRWRPDLIGAEERVLHLALAGELPGVFLRRLRAAAASGARVTVAFAAVLDDVEQMLSLQRLDARVIGLELGEWGYRAREYRSIADWLAAGSFYLADEDFRRLAGERLASALTGGDAKGRWFEEALCLLFNQVSWLTVEEHAYRNSSEEIDLVLSARAGGHAARLAGAPMVLATAKNETHATGSSVVKYLKEQIANRRGRCKLGFLCSATTISPDARREILRGSQSSETVIVPLDGEMIASLIQRPAELDERVEQLIVKAIAD